MVLDETPSNLSGTHFFWFSSRGSVSCFVGETTIPRLNIKEDVNCQTDKWYINHRNCPFPEYSFILFRITSETVPVWCFLHTFLYLFDSFPFLLNHHVSRVGNIIDGKYTEVWRLDIFLNFGIIILQIPDTGLKSWCEAWTLLWGFKTFLKLETRTWKNYRRSLSGNSQLEANIMKFKNWNRPLFKINLSAYETVPYCVLFMVRNVDLLQFFDLVFDGWFYILWFLSTSAF